MQTWHGASQNPDKPFILLERLGPVPNLLVPAQDSMLSVVFLDELRHAAGLRFRLSVLRNPPVTPARDFSWRVARWEFQSNSVFAKEYNFFLLEYNGEARGSRLIAC